MEKQEELMNGFSYNENEKKITIHDGTTVIWENVEKDIAEEAGKMFGESRNIDNFLMGHGCKRYWGNR